MQSTIYVCDGCDSVIGKVKHLSILADLSVSGIASPPTKNKHHWQVKSFSERFIHFHNGNCAKHYFDIQLKK